MAVKEYSTTGFGIVQSFLAPTRTRSPCGTPFQPLLMVVGGSAVVNDETVEERWVNHERGARQLLGNFACAGFPGRSAFL